MNERRTFEMRLETMFSGYADRAPVEVDAAEMASQIAAARPRHAYDRMTARNRWLVPALIGLLLLVTMAAAAIAGAQLLRQEPLNVIQLPEPRDYAGILRPIGAGQIAPDGAIGLRDGRVLAVRTGFNDQSMYQILDPDTGVIRDVGAGQALRYSPAMVELDDGRVLVVGSDYAQERERGSGADCPDNRRDRRRGAGRDYGCRTDD